MLVFGLLSPVSPPLTNLIDSYLLFRIRTKRDPEAFARIYDRYVEAIYRFAYLKLPRKEDAQDVTAETFTRAWQYMSEHRNIVHIRALLYRILRNLIADFYRSQKKEVPLEELVTIEGYSATSYGEGATVSDPSKLAVSDNSEARADFALILQRLERLKEDYRDVLTLRLIDDLPFAVIGEILEKSTGNVRVIYHRGLKALKEIESP